MKILMKFPVYFNLRRSSKTQFKLITQSLFYGPNLTTNINYNAVCDTSDALFSHFKYSSEQEKILQLEYDLKRNVLATELCDECCIQESVSHLKKISLLNLNIEALHNLDLLPSPDDIIKNMLSYLEPFPFSMHEKFLQGSIRKKNKQIQGVTISMLRDSIEKQYLAWKFKVNFEMIERIVMHLRSSFFNGRSVQSLRRNLEWLDQCYKLNKINMTTQLYLYSQMAFSTKVLEDFEENLFGLDWFQIAVCFPSVLRKPYHCVMLRIKALKEEGFSDEQLMNAFPLLNVRSLNLMEILTFFKDLPNIYNHRDDLYFLRFLLLYAKRQLKDYDWSLTNYEDLRSELSKQERFSKGFSELIKIPRVTISLYAQVKLGANEEQLEAMKSNYKNYSFSLRGLSETLLFLQENKFTAEEIIDCITIIFYPRQVIQNVLKTMNKDKEALKKLGFVNGRVNRKTLFFERGSTLRNKTLHICLYYIQKANNFSVGQGST